MGDGEEVVWSRVLVFVRVGRDIIRFLDLRYLVFFYSVFMDFVFNIYMSYVGIRFREVRFVSIVEKV